ncbi:putative cyclin domain-containing protein [Dioscorea sansibarensis]
MPPGAQLNKSPLWSEEHSKATTGFSEPEILECTKMMVNFHSLSAESKLKVVHKKYSSSQHCAVALQLPSGKMCLRG